MKNFTTAFEDALSGVATKKSMALLCVKPGIYVLVVGGKRIEIRFAHIILRSGGENTTYHLLKDTEFVPTGHDEGLIASVDLKHAEMLITLNQAQYSTSVLQGAGVIDRVALIGGSTNAAMAVYYDRRLPKQFSYQLVRGEDDAERLFHQGLWHMIDHESENIPKEWSLQQLSDSDEE